MDHGKGTITVFLSLVSVLFLSLLCTAVESARMQGCRAKAAAALDMGMFSVMGEFERELLEHYDVFFLDGAAGTGVYSTDQLGGTLQKYMEYNVYPTKGQLLGGFDPFAIGLTSASVTGVTLATDENGAAFYQAAVGFMRENLGTEVISTWLSRSSDGERLKKAQDAYKQQEQSAAGRLEELQEQQRQLEEEQQRQLAAQQEQIVGEGGGEAYPQPQPESLPQIPDEQNPLEIIKKIKNEGLLGLVLKDRSAVSQKKLSSDRPSKRSCQRGNLKIEKKYGGLVDNLIFQEYLFERFPLFTDREYEGVLDYGLEYILCGKDSDEKNLRSVASRLLMLRAGANFLYLAGDDASMLTAQGLATALVGAIPLPGLQTVTSLALLTAWAYAEGLVDVRELLAGGKVPVLKTASDWKLGLQSIPSLLSVLESTDGSSENGLSYAGYLQILFTLGNQRKYAMRALDLIEGYMRARASTAAFRMDHAVYQIEAEADFTIFPLFLKVSNAFLKTGVTTGEYHAKGRFMY